MQNQIPFAAMPVPPKPKTSGCVWAGCATLLVFFISVVLLMLMVTAIGPIVPGSGPTGSQPKTPVEDEYGAKPTPTFWSGAPKAAVDYVKGKMNDPDSFKVVSVTEPVRDETSNGIKCWSVRMKYSGTNAFGGRVSAEYYFWILNDLVLEVMTEKQLQRSVDKELEREAEREK